MRSDRKLAVRIACLFACLVLFGKGLSAAPIYTVSFGDPGGAYSSYYSQIESSLLGAGAYWNKFLGGQSSSIDLVVQFDSFLPTATGSSATSAFVTTRGGFNIFEQGVAAELRTGIDANGLAPDGIITIGAGYLTNELWFDPNPSFRTDAIPIDRTDAVSVFTHELGHILGFNGWMNPFDGTLPADYESTFDQYVTFDGENLYFGGPQAVNVYGGLVPLTFGNFTHLGNSFPRPGEDLIPDLMNGVAFYRGTRYEVSRLDLAILEDVGVPIQAPEPVSVIVLTVGLVGLVKLRLAKK